MASRAQTQQRKPATRTRKAPARAAKSRAATRPTPRRSAKARPASAFSLPAWSDLSAKKSNAVRQKREAKPGLVDGVPTFRFAVLLVLTCALFTLYVGHVYATQELAAEVQQLQKEKLRLVLKHNRLRGEFDRMTAPSVILDRAADLGLEPGTEYGPTILVGQDD